MNDTSLYEIELWSRQNVYVADISMLAKSFNYSMERNAAESFELELDLYAFEDLCASMNALPMTILYPYKTDIKVKRDGEYLFRVHVIETNTDLGVDNATIKIKGLGYLDLLSDRYVTKTYTAQYETDIVQDLITETQSQTNGSLGITFGTQTQLVQRDRTYERQNVKEAILNLTNLVDGNFDFKIDHNKVLTTYPLIGSDRSKELVFVYPGNIKTMSIPRTGIKLFNKVYGIGAGFGEDQIQSTQVDTSSQLDFGVHEEVRTWNSVLAQETLDQNATARLANVKNILEIPQITVSGKDFDMNDYGIGDTVTVRVKNHKFLNNIYGKYRIERIEVTVDENQDEDIKMYFDNEQVDA